MAKSKRSGKAHSAGYSNYKTSNRESANRLKKLTRLFKENPNNKQLEVAIKNIHHRRHTPKEPFWSKQRISEATILKAFKGRFSKDVFSVDPKVQHAALVAVDPNKIKLPTEKVSQFNFFSIKERAHTKDGTLLWK